jgi:hypothetical protein
MGVGVCYVSVTNVTKRKQQSLSCEADGWARTIHSNPPHTIPWRCITLYLPNTLVFSTGLPPSRSQTKSHYSCLSLSTDISFVTKSVHSVTFRTLTKHKPNNHNAKYSPLIAHRYSTASRPAVLFLCSVCTELSTVWHPSDTCSYERGYVKLG